MPDPKSSGRPRLPINATLDTLLGSMPDEPIGDVSGFDRLAEEGDRDRLEKLNALFETQQACDVVLKHHGPEVLRHVLRRVAEASIAHGVAPYPRVAEVARYYGLQGP